MTVGTQALEDFRKRAHLTRNDVCVRAGIDARTLGSKLDVPGAFSREEVHRLARAVETTTRDLVTKTLVLSVLRDRRRSSRSQ